MNFNKRALLFTALTAAFVVTTAMDAQRPEVLELKVPMADGVRLATDVYLPASEGRFPVVLVRTPYDRKQLADPFYSAFVRAGYAVVSQDVRGMNGSEGRFLPFISERQDGLATLDWIASQSWSDGNVGVWGPSYVGFCGMVLATDGRPQMKAVVNLSGWSDSDEMVSPGGALHMMIALPWTLSSQISGQRNSEKIDWTSAFLHLPVRDIPAALGLQGAAWDGTERLIAAGTLAKQASVTNRLDRVKIPILHLTGWYDFVSPHVFDAYQRIVAGRPPATAPQALVVGPWSHDQIWGRRTQVGDQDFGPDSAMGSDRVVELSLRWFDQHLKRRPSALQPQKLVRLFVMGENAWHDFDGWPPSTTQERTWYVQSGKGANGLAGDGVLSERRGRDSKDVFRYDPNDPVPTVGGVNSHFFADNLGPRDQRQVEARRDVLVYTTAPLSAPLTIIGPLRVVVHASTTGKQIDMTAKLVDVRQDGYAAILADGIRRGPDTADGVVAAALAPGKPYKFTINLGATAIRLGRGHRLRLEISSGNFPKYIRNPATGEDPFLATRLVATEQTVYHSRQYPTYLVANALAGR